MTDYAELRKRLLRVADCDARAGEPLGKCMREAADAIAAVVEARDGLAYFKRLVSQAVRDRMPAGQHPSQADSALGVVGWIVLEREGREAAETERDALRESLAQINLALTGQNDAYFARAIDTEAAEAERDKLRAALAEAVEVVEQAAPLLRNYQAYLGDIGNTWGVEWAITRRARAFLAQHAPTTSDPVREAGDRVRPCTCHPDDDPPRPCPQRFALSECRRAAANQGSSNDDR